MSHTGADRDAEATQHKAVADPDTQLRDLQQLVEALRDPQCYPHPVDQVEVIETHISYVLLAGDYAYKLKKPLNLGFLDFSSPERRSFYCAEELRLNRRLAPDYYLDCPTIGGSPERPRFDADGAPLTTAVRMRRFPQQALLDQQLLAGALLPEQMDRIADRVAEFHESVERSPHGRFGDPAQVHEPVSDNFRHIRSLSRDTGLLDSLRQIEEQAEADFRRLRPLLEHRRSKGFVRECHGDLHLGNMARVDDRILIFDCIEFNDDFRWIDVISEVAFFCMDLLQRGQRDLAWRFLNRYLERTGDYEGVALMPYYTSYRAMVRAKVAAIRASQAEPGGREAEAALAECRDYMELARSGSHPRYCGLLLTHGVSGSGKSTISQAMLGPLGAIRIRSDVERKRLFGVPRDAQGTERAGLDLYSAKASRATYQKLLTLAGPLLRAGFPVILDATYLQRQHRQPARDLARSLDVPYVILACEADTATLQQWLAQRAARGGDPSEADTRVMHQQLRERQEPEYDEAAFVVTVRSDRCIDPQSMQVDLGPVLPELRRRLDAASGRNSGEPA